LPVSSSEPSQKSYSPGSAWSSEARLSEGDIIHHCLNRYVVRHGKNITKYTTNPHGLDGSGTPNEALALRFVKEHTTIPVPELVSSDWDRVTMEYVEGQTLKQAWPVLTPEQRSGIMAQLSDYLAQLRAMGGIHLGRLDGHGVVVPNIMTRCGGPFGSLVEFHDWLANPPKRGHAESIYWHEITTQLGADYPIIFTHGDVAARNIMVRDGRIVAILDWEYAGWYPAYWDYVFTMRGLDNVDWETLGRYAPSLFTERYDLEYILMGFILRIS
jgi:tRNA A-37 threonylcarbamoyl transferase component Bud32